MGKKDSFEVRNVIMQLSNISKACFAFLIAFILVITSACNLPESVVSYSLPKTRIIGTTSISSKKHLSSSDDLKQIDCLWHRVRSQFSIKYNENDPQVQYHIKQFQRYKSSFYKTLSQGKPYLYYIVEELEKQKLPAELALLPLIESEYDPKAESRSGAIGLWQIMPNTGTWFGLTQDWWYDGRHDIPDSTQAALRYLSYLNKFFDGDWLHVFAAYNSGEGTVQRSIKRNRRLGKETHFQALSLPKQTKNYVPKLLAAVSIVKNPDKYGFKLKSISDKPVLTQIYLPEQVRFSEVAKATGMSIREIERFNPGYHRKTTHPKGPQHLVLPVIQAQQLAKVLANEQLEFRKGQLQHIVSKGESLSLIALKHSTQVSAIIAANQLKNDKIYSGQKLLIPEPSPSKIHVVKKGESLWSISKKYQVSLNALANSNTLANNGLLQPGQKLIVQLS